MVLQSTDSGYLLVRQALGSRAVFLTWGSRSVYLKESSNGPILERVSVRLGFLEFSRGPVCCKSGRFLSPLEHVRRTG